MSVDRSLRPAASDSAVLAIDLENSNASLVGVGIQTNANCFGDYVFNEGQAYDPGRLRLPLWREIIEEHLQDVHFDVLDEEGDLAITLTVSQCIKLAEAFLAAAREWDYDDIPLPSLSQVGAPQHSLHCVTEDSVIHDNHLLKPST